MRILACVVVLCATALLLGACALPRAAPESSAAQAADPAVAALRQLLDDSDEAFLRRNPIYAIYRGDERFLDQFGDGLSDAYVALELAAARDDLRRLDSIARERLPAADRVAYDTFKWQRTLELRKHDPAFTALWLPLQLDHYNGVQLYFAELSSGHGVAPYRSVADYDAGLARIDGFVLYLDRALARCREGLARGVVQPRVVVERMIVQFDNFAGQGLEDSPYYGPIRAFPAAVPAAERERLDAAYANALRERLVPAFRRVRDALRDEVLPRSRSSVSLGELPGGADYYRHLIELHTTTAGLTAEQVHRTGLAEVERITQGMEAVRAQVGYTGTLAQFFEHVRSDPRFRPASAEALGALYAAVGVRVDAALPRLFSTKPRATLELRPTPDFQAPTDAAARYESASADGSRPGIFYYNTYDLASREIVTAETLYLHEAVPGHHFQGSLAQEQEQLPKLLRFEGNTAYWEGWALYAESLGAELGLFTDPYQRYGHYNDEMVRAMRLVVDTGLHAYGWSREQAIDYMLGHSAMSRSDVVAEVERYIADPGRALGYKIGQLTLTRLRAEATRALGARFDVRAFHDQVLLTGAVPMAVLQAKIDAWVRAQQAARADTAR